MAENLLPPPKQFNTEVVDVYTEWKMWISSFHIYVTAVELEKKSEEVQVATMLHCLGPAVQRIFRTLPGKNENCKEAVEVLEGYFAPKETWLPKDINSEAGSSTSTNLLTRIFQS